MSRKVAVVGISPDPPATQANFKQKHRLPFPLLADTERVVAHRYGVIDPNTLAGRWLKWVRRTTFLIGPDGRIQRIFRNVSASGHARQVLAALGESIRGQPAAGPGHAGRAGDG